LPHLITKSDTLEKMGTTNLLQRCEWLVIAMYGREGAKVWWETPNIAFDMKPPKDIDVRILYDFLMEK